MKSGFKTSLQIALFFFGAFMLCILVSPQSAKAQIPCFYNFCPFGTCLPGLPCVGSVAEKTPDEPDNLNDGPNFPKILPFPDPLHAPNRKKSESHACDADFMNQIFGRAQLHAARQVRMSTSLIRKPDSVLEYSCFEETAKTALELGPILTETQRWGIPTQLDLVPSPDTDTIDPFLLLPIPILGFINKELVDIKPVLINIHMGIQLFPTLQSVLMGIDPTSPLQLPSGLVSYYFWNYGHDFLGGYAVGENNDVFGVSVDDLDDYGEIFGYLLDGAFLPPIPAFISEPDTYSCDKMAKIYQLSKCLDFGVEDRFFEFDFLVNNDIRSLPRQCWSLSISDPVSFVFPIAFLRENFDPRYIDVSKNDDYFYVNFDEADQEISKLLDAAPCGKPVPTGAMVTKTESIPGFFGTSTNIDISFEEKICRNPSCYYDNIADQCKNAP
jgi:hypothetical protein